jgi:hypothetical protein
VTEKRPRPPVSLETRRKRSVALLGRRRGPRSEEVREKIAAAQRGRVFTEEHRAKLRAARAAEDRTPTPCPCGAGPFQGPRALSNHRAHKHRGEL